MGQKIHREIQLKPQEAFWLDLMQLPHCIDQCRIEHISRPGMELCRFYVGRNIRFSAPIPEAVGAHHLTASGASGVLSVCGVHSRRLGCRP